MSTPHINTNGTMPPQPRRDEDVEGADIPSSSVTTPQHHASILNINVGILGHVDSGKTSLSRALSTIASTAAFDKNPQSMERGITLDLGFSSVVCDLVGSASDSSDSTSNTKSNECDDGSRSRNNNNSNNKPFKDRLPLAVYDRYVRTAGISTVQLTLVDCPGHASLIRTIIGGASIVDVMILVIDVTKGIQTQTAECLVLGEVLGRRLLVVLNKVDLIKASSSGGSAKPKKKKSSASGGDAAASTDDGAAPSATSPQPASSMDAAALEEAERRHTLDKIKKRLRAVFAQTKWPDVTFVEVAAAPGNSADKTPSAGDGDKEEDGETDDAPVVDSEADLAERIAAKKKLQKQGKKAEKKTATSGKKDGGGDEEQKGGSSGASAHAAADAMGIPNPTNPYNVGGVVDALLQMVDPIALLKSRDVTGAMQTSTAATSMATTSNNAPSSPSSSPNSTNNHSNHHVLLQAAKRNFIMYVDHCFAVKGHGTVLTGTVASGLVAVGDDVTLPDLQQSKRVKSLQVFHEPVREAKQGDRVGLCVAGLDPKLVERGIICSANALFLSAGKGSAITTVAPNTTISHLQELVTGSLALSVASSALPLPLSLPLSIPQRLAAAQSTIIRGNCFIAAVRKVRFHKQSLLTSSANGHKYHITVGHSTAMGTLRYFSAPNPYHRNNDNSGQKKKKAGDGEGDGNTVEANGRFLAAQEASLVQLVDLFFGAQQQQQEGSGPNSKKVGGGGGGATVNPALLNSKNVFPFGFSYEDELLDDEDEDEDPAAEKQQSKGGDTGFTDAEGGFVPPLLASSVAKAPRRRDRVMFAIVQLDTPIVLSTCVSGETLGLLTSSSSSSSSSSAAPRRHLITHPQTMLLASRFDTDLKSSTCRLAVEGSVVSVLADWDLPLNVPDAPTPSVSNMIDVCSSGGSGGADGHVGSSGVARPAPPKAILPHTLMMVERKSGSSPTPSASASSSSLSSAVGASVDLLQHWLFTAYRTVHWRSLPIAKSRSKTFPVDKILDDCTCIVKVPPKPIQQQQQQQSSNHHNPNAAGPSSAGGAAGAATKGKGPSSAALQQAAAAKPPPRDMSVFVKLKVFALMTVGGGRGGRGGGRGRGRGGGATGRGTADTSASEAAATPDNHAVDGEEEEGTTSASAAAAVMNGTSLAAVGGTAASSSFPEWGVVEAPFGQNGNKLRVKFNAPIYRRGQGHGAPRAPRDVVLPYQKYPFAAHSPMMQ